MTSLELPLPELAAHFQLRPNIAFLNHGSFGACPRPVYEAYQHWQSELEQQPVEFLGRRLNHLLSEARTKLAEYLHTQTDCLVWVPNATHGVNIVARSLDLQPGDQVLATDHEYGAVNRTWQFICEQRGVEYRMQPLALPFESADALVEQFWAGVTEQTRVISISHITSPTALILPIEQICQRARAAGILTVIDGAHAPGQIPLDMEAIGADFYTGNCHKWLCNQRASGFLYARPEVQHLLQPLIVSWGWRARSPSDNSFHDLFDWTGTFDPAPYLSAPAAIAFQQEHNWPEVRDACHNLLLSASQRIGELTGLPPISPDTSDWWVQMRALPLPPCNIGVVKARLWDEYQIEVPLMEFLGQPLIRISIQAYNTPEDIDRLVEGLTQLIHL